MIRSALLLFPLLSLLAGCRSAEPTNHTRAELRAVQEQLRTGDPRHRYVQGRVLAAAEAALAGPAYTIVAAGPLAPSGDPHDYLSLGPYWWPDPSQPDGLPWIRRDGEVNPVTQGPETDKAVKNALFDAVAALADGSYFLGDPRYARRADALLDTFFVHPATRMNPHLDYAQGIPGRSAGRCFGIIELTGVAGLVTSLELLAPAEEIRPATRAGVNCWLSDYLDWLQTSPLGIEEGNRANNHGSWYDVQRVVLLRYLGRPDEARQILTAAREGRIAAQIAPDGRQPEELARTKSLSYSTMNLRALTTLAYHGRRLGVDLWDYVAPNGASLPRAYAFLEPYVRGAADWPYPQLGDPDRVLGGTRALFARAGRWFDHPEYCALAADLPPPTSPADLLTRCTD